MASVSKLPLVVKVGGSLAGTSRLDDVLDSIATAARPLVVVPGGGEFADKVRDLQRAVGFDDAAAHRLAMLGMHQMADVFVALDSRLEIAASLDGITDVAKRGRVPVWVPLPMLENDTTIPENWATTSDTIAARLAERLGGAPLVLIKSVDVDGDIAAVDLARDGVVDQAFPEIVARAGLAWKIFGPAKDTALREFLGAAASVLVKS